MDFFKTDEGLIHTGRIAGTFYLIALVRFCLLPVEFDRLCALRSAFAVGWWLVFCGKQPPRVWSQFTTHPISILGFSLIVVGLVGQSYLSLAR